MQRSSRLTGSKRYSEIHENGISSANRFLVIRVLANSLDQSRFGFLVGKRIGNAVVRNKVKRRLKEAVRSNQIETGWDAIFIARQGSEKANAEELRKAAFGLLKRNNLVIGDSQAPNPITPTSHSNQSAQP